MIFRDVPRPAIRRTTCLFFAAAVAGAEVAGAAAGSGSTRATGAANAGSVIVRARSGREPAVEALVRRLGGSVAERLGIIGGFSATLPAGRLTALRASADVLSVTPNRRLSPQSSSYAADYDPASDDYSMSSITQLTGARAWWNAGYTRKGVDVALIDSGVVPVQGLADWATAFWG
jgi:serine protease AprX